jgi:tRNA(Ile)-lysidine synthase
VASRRPSDPFVAVLGRRLSGLLQDVPAKRLCVALSGGPDSVALAAGLAALRMPIPLRALHVNHHLQAQADDWMRECRRLGRALGMPVSVRHVTVVTGRGRSLEAAAREARRAAFLAALRPGEALLTAHHLDDQLETLLLMLMRGSGVHGLAAMPAVQTFGCGWLMRPLLDEPRASLSAFVARHGLPHVLDESNADERFDRNFLRRRVTPVLAARWPGSARAAARSARWLGEARGLLDELAEADLVDLERPAAAGVDGSRGIGRSHRTVPRRSLDLATLAALSPARQRNALRAWLRRQGVRPPDEVHLERIRVELPGARRDAQPVVRWSEAEVRRFRGRLHLLHPPPAGSRPPGRAVVGRWEWSRGRPFSLGPGRGALRLVSDPDGMIARSALPARLQVRTRAPGAKLVLREAGPRRTVKELLRSAGVLPWERDRIPVVCAGTRIVALGDLFIAAPYLAAGRPGRGRLRLEWVAAPEICAAP